MRRLLHILNLPVRSWKTLSVYFPDWEDGTQRLFIVRETIVYLPFCKIFSMKFWHFSLPAIFMLGEMRHERRTGKNARFVRSGWKSSIWLMKKIYRATLWSVSVIICVKKDVKWLVGTSWQTVLFFPKSLLYLVGREWERLPWKLPKRDIDLLWLRHASCIWSVIRDLNGLNR